MSNKCKWEYFDKQWIWNNFKESIEVKNVHHDILVTLLSL
jgi:hypothetical protein